MPLKVPPLVVPWQSRQVRVGHDDETLRPYSPKASIVMSAMQLVSSVDGLRTILPMAVGDRYLVDVRDDAEGVVLRLLRR